MSFGAQAPERELLSGFLDWNRAVAAGKVADLPLDLATRVLTPTRLSPLNVLAHLAAVEYGWFDENFAGNPVRDDLDDHGEFRLHPGDTVASVVAEYEEACEHSRAIAARVSSLDELSVRAHHVWGNVTLRWVFVHMLEETARHAGHLDLMREQLDGRTG